MMKVSTDVPFHYAPSYVLHRKFNDFLKGIYEDKLCSTMTCDFLAEPIEVILKHWSSYHQHTFLAKSVVVALKHWSSHPKVGEFDCSTGVDQAVPKYI